MMETKEGNKLIAEFMGCEFSQLEYEGGFYHNNPKLNEEGDDYGFISDLKYHSSWDWLMPVVTKIVCEFAEDGENYYFRTFGMINHDTGNIMVRFNRFGVFEAETLLEATYLAVVEFIKWHNSPPPLTT